MFGYVSAHRRPVDSVRIASRSAQSAQSRRRWFAGKVAFVSGGRSWHRRRACAQRLLNGGCKVLGGGAVCSRSCRLSDS